ncbi:MAG: hypothetical protein O7F71_17910 [Gammaproteobacteria bacterium]|nr:hypothetical protein [Gammaproteobacteria bacterium]
MSQLPGSDWHVLWGDGDLTLRIRSGSQLGEDTSGEMGFRPSAEGCWIEFTIDDEDCLWVQTVGHSYRLTETPGGRAGRIRLEPGTLIELPNNRLHISNNLRPYTLSGVTVALTPVSEPDIETVVDSDYPPTPTTSREPAVEPSFDRHSLEDTRPVSLSRYKWFLLGPLLGIIILIAMTIWVAMEPLLSR